MSSSQKEFVIGCLLGGLLGAASALLVPKAAKLLPNDGLNGFAHTKTRKKKTHTPAPLRVARKARPKKAVKEG